MAALIRHGVFKLLRNPIINHVRTYATKAEKRKGIDRIQPPKIYTSTAESIAAKGFLRPQKEYQPPENVNSRLNEIFVKILGNDNVDLSTCNYEKRFNLLLACSNEFEHSIPNSLLHTIQSLDDLRTFYQTPVDTKTPLDKMRNMELPENLHIQFDYHRFHPETDTKFNGQTAFNRSSTLVTGLKYKEKYKGHKQNQEWPYNS